MCLASAPSSPTALLWLHPACIWLHPDPASITTTITSTHTPHTASLARPSLPRPCSAAQVRGSIPLPWAQRPDSSMLKPEIVLHNFDPLFAATRRHFDQLRWAGWVGGWVAVAGWVVVAVFDAIGQPQALLPTLPWLPPHARLHLPAPACPHLPGAAC